MPQTYQKTVNPLRLEYFGIKFRVKFGIAFSFFFPVVLMNY